MKAYIAVTDNAWFTFLRCRPDLDEVSFWPPAGGRRFQALSPGELLLFKLHRPESCIAGGGFFTHFSFLPCSLAWEAFGEKNGAASAAQMRRRIERQHLRPPGSGPELQVGCILLHTPFFFDEADWFPPPSDFHPNTAHGKVYDLRTSAGRALWEAVRVRLEATGPRPEGTGQASMFSEPVAIHAGLGAGTFRVVLTDVYQRRCAVSAENTLAALEPTHIRPVEEGGLHRIDNGLLLRADLERLFRRGHLTVTPDYRVQLSASLREGADARDHYYGHLHGGELWVPPETSRRPRRELLEWHAATVFRE